MIVFLQVLLVAAIWQFIWCYIRSRSIYLGEGEPHLKYFDCLQIDGNASKEEVFAQIDGALTTLLEQRKAASESVVA